MNRVDALNNLCLDLGYTRFGALKVDDFKKKSLFPSWVKSIIICPWHFNFNKKPEKQIVNLDLKEVFKGRYYKGSHEKEAADAVESFLEEHDIRYMDASYNQSDKMIQLACDMKIGRVRKNTKFYTEEGSHCYFHIWLIDEDMVYINDEAPTECPDHCSRCIRNCPSQSLTKGYHKSMDQCLEHDLSMRNANIINGNIHVSNIKYVKGCTLCEDICPFNDDRWEEEEDFVVFDKMTSQDGPEDLINYLKKIRQDNQTLGVI